MSPILCCSGCICTHEVPCKSLCSVLTCTPAPERNTGVDLFLDVPESSLIAKVVW